MMSGLMRATVIACTALCLHVAGARAQFAIVTDPYDTRGALEQMTRMVAELEARPHVVRPLDGLVCTVLNVPEAQLADRQAKGIPILAEPRPDAAQLVTASNIVFARVPAHIVNGYAEVVTINNQPGWIAAGAIRPFDPLARCVPSLMSNGRVGAG